MHLPEDKKASVKVPSFGEQITILDAGCFFQGQVNACVWGPPREETAFFTSPGFLAFLILFIYLGAFTFL